MSKSGARPRRSIRTLSLALTIGALAVSLGGALATGLTLYPNFAEVREQVNATGNAFNLTLPAELAGSLVPGTLNLEGVTVSKVTQVAATDSLLSAFVGREVSVQRGLQVVKARVLDATRNLFQLPNGSVFTADPGSVTFPDMNGVRFNPSWQFTLAAGGPATLSYLTRAISWSPRYDLTMNGDTGSSWWAWADVNNQSSVVYDASRLDLVAGQVNTAGPRYFESMATAKMADSASVQSNGESAGLRLYKLEQAVNFAPRSTTSVPFTLPHVSTQRLLEYRGSFSAMGKQILPLQRVYDVTPDDDLPAGIVTIRDEGRVVGQAGLPDTTKNETQTLGVGQDFDLRLTRTVSVLENSKAQSRYKVTFSLVNTKTRTVTVRLLENLTQYGRSFELSSVILPNLKRDLSGFTALATLGPSARMEASYQVTYKPLP